MGELEESQAIHQRATDIREKALGPDHEHTLKSKGNLALTLHQQRRYKEAEKLNIEVLEARKRTLGEDHEDTLLSISTYSGNIYARTMFRQQRCIASWIHPLMSSNRNL